MSLESNRRYIVARFGSDYLEASNHHLRYNCPFCETEKGRPDTRYHLYVSYKKLAYYCFRCGSKGRLVPEDSQGVIPEWSEVLKAVSSFLGRSQKDESDDLDLYELPDLYPHEVPEAYKYLRSRGLTDEAIEFYNIRVGSALSNQYGRVIVPNRVIGKFTDMYVGRSYIGQEPKYRNPGGKSRSKVVFNLHRIERGSPLIICEGVFSAMITGRAAVATYGKYVSEKQLSLIVDHKPESVYVALDPDALNEACDLCDRLVSKGVKTYLVRMPDGEDPASLGHIKMLELIRASKPYTSRELIMAENYLSRLRSRPELRSQNV